MGKRSRTVREVGRCGLLEGCMLLPSYVKVIIVKSMVGIMSMCAV